MVPERLIQGLLLVLLGAGGMGAVDIASYFQQPLLAWGYLLASLIFTVSGIFRLVRAF